jgi:hypothetical protein
MEDIRKFSKSISLFVVLVIIPYLILGSVQLYNGDYKLKVTPAIYDAIDKCTNKKVESNIIIFTDSAGAQIYSESDSDGSDFYLVNTTRAIGLPGQYILLRKLIENKENEISGKRFYLMVIPSVFMDNLNQKYTYNYFVKPFYNSEFKHYIDEYTLDHISQIPMANLSQFPIIKTTNWSIDYPNAEDFAFIEEYFISDISMLYLKKFKELAEEYNFNIKILSPYLREAKRSSSIALLKEQVKENSLDEMFSEYFQSFNFLPDSVFVDQDHFDDNLVDTEYDPYNLLNNNLTN